MTGVPGAGKTLVGINLASSRDDSGANRVFLSGNYPLVSVLQGALLRNRVETINLIKERMKYGEKLTEQQELIASQANFVVFPKRNGLYKVTGKFSQKNIAAEIATKIQLVPHFREGYDENEQPPNEHVFIFDEAQRAWSAEKVKKEEKRDDGKSEPDILLSYLNRHSDWCVAIALVGTGQDIHDGEAGIEEWYKALSSDFQEWEIYIANSENSDSFIHMAEMHKDNMTFNPALFLDHPMRSFRAQKVSNFIDSLLRGKDGLEDAKQCLKALHEPGVDGRISFPVYITRNLEDAKTKVRILAHGSERYGLLISSKAKRLRHYGLFAPERDFDQIAWFLDDKDSINSSYSLEVAASEFKIQGLEIDYSLVGWDADFKFDKTTGQFVCQTYSVADSKWKEISGINADMEKRHLINAYRVILTRARQGMVIFVPTGDISENDKTVLPQYYNDTYDFLKSIGLSEL